MPAFFWPNPQDYAGVLQHPRIAFRNKDLWGIQILTNQQGLPRVWAGAFANVYQATLPDGTKRAIRVFISAMPERGQRLETVAAYLRDHPLKCLVDFIYDDRSICSARDGKFYPLVTMGWVSGETLYDWVRGRCLQENRNSLDRACELWVDTIAELSGAGIAHGDLSHGNVMIADGPQPKIKLVDYDCLCVPGLMGLKNLEIGVEPYQHPQRDANTRLSPNLHSFSAMFIYAALRALAANPKLWHTYVEKPPPYDKLLFRREDLEAPQSSLLMRDLRTSGSQEVWRLARDLAELARTPLDQVPPLSSTLFSWDTVRSLLSQKQFDEAVELVTRNHKQASQAPPPLRAQLQNAEQRVQQRLALERAVSAGDEARIQRLYVPQLLDDYPAARDLVAKARLASRPSPPQEEPDTSGHPPTPPDFDGGSGDGGRWFDRLYFTVLHAEKVKPGQIGRIFAYAHVKSLADQVVDDAKRRLKLPRGTEMVARAEEALGPVPVGCCVKVIVDVPGLVLDVVEAMMSLWEEVQHVEFRFKVPPSRRARLYSGWVRFLLGGIRLAADVPVEIFAPAESATDALQEALAKANAQPYRAVFPSYARDDNTVVECLERYAAAFGDEYLRDVQKLRPGQEWNPELMRFIRSADVFQLFWSEHAATSGNVQREWREALHERKVRPDPYFLRPVYWSKTPAAFEIGISSSLNSISLLLE